MAAVAIITKLVSSWMQFGILFAPDALKLDFNRLNPLSQLKQMFSAQSVMNLLMSIVKATLLGLILYVVIWPSWGVDQYGHQRSAKLPPGIDRPVPLSAACLSRVIAGAGAYRPRNAEILLPSACA